MPDNPDKSEEPSSSADKSPSADDSTGWSAPSESKSKVQPIIQAGGSDKTPPPELMPPAPTSTKGSKKKTVLNATAIDFDACRQVFSRIVGSKEVQGDSHIVLREPGTGVVADNPEPINNYRMATACPADWVDMIGTDQFRICGQCKLNVYNLTGMNLEATKALVFKREGQDAQCFYRRQDGKFLTHDCPVGIRRGQTTLLGIGAGILLILGCISMAFLSPPPPKPTAIEEKPQQVITPPSQSIQTSSSPNPIHSNDVNKELYKEWTQVGTPNTSSQTAGQSSTPKPGTIPIITTSPPSSNLPK